MSDEAHFTVRLLFGLIVAGLVISWVAYLINIDAKIRKENEITIYQMDMEREKELLTRGFVIQEGVLWPIPTGHQPFQELPSPEVDF